MSWRQQLRLAAYLLALSVATAAAQYDYIALADQDHLQSGDGTFYGQQQDQDDRGACSFSENGAHSMNMSWTLGAALSLAINKDQFDGSKACGTCILYKGVGGGIGVTPLSTTQWYMGFVNNICPECSRGSLDQDIDGDGRWRIEWYAVPCNVGDSKMRFDLVQKHYYWISIVVSNHRVPITAVSVKINGKWLDLQRSVTNQWPYHRENGDWENSFPMPIRVTSVFNETLEDVIESQDGSTGKIQFAQIPGPEYVSAAVPGRGYRPNNAFVLKNPGDAVPNLGPIKGANAYGVLGWGNSSSGSQVQQMPSIATGTTSNGYTFSASTLLLDDGQQCGGTTGECTARDRGEPVRPCIPGAWPLALCKDPASTCKSVQGTACFECHPSPLGTTPAIEGGASGSPSLEASPAPSSPSPASAGESGGSSPSPQASPSSSPSPAAPAPGRWQSAAEVASGGRRLLHFRPS